MKLIKLTDDNWTELRGKPVCCFMGSADCLREMCEAWPLFPYIICLADENAKEGQVCSFQGKELPVHAPEVLETMNLTDAVLLIADDYYREAFEKLKEIDAVRRSISRIYYFENRENKYGEAFLKKYADCPLRDIIVFRSGPHTASCTEGMDFDDNARALFEYMLENGFNRKYELIWLVKEPGKFKRYENCPNLTFLSFDWSVSEEPEKREEYYRALCLARYLFFTDAYGFARNCRRDQVRIQLWHGCGFKTRVNFVRCEKRYEYMTVSSSLYAEIHERIYGLRPEQLLITGCAKQDWLFDPVNRREMERLRIPHQQKYIFWLPTFREAEGTLPHLRGNRLPSETGLPAADSRERLERLNRMLKQSGVMLVIKPHPFQKKGTISCEGFSNIFLLTHRALSEADIPLNRLLGRADALISDYSSAAVDFLLLDRPMAFTLVDEKEYEQSRGFVFDHLEEWLPGQPVFSFDDLCTFIKEAAAGADAAAGKRRLLRDRMHRFHNKGSCKRIVEALGMT